MKFIVYLFAGLHSFVPRRNAGGFFVVSVVLSLKIMSHFHELSSVAISGDAGPPADWYTCNFST